MTFLLRSLLFELTIKYSEKADKVKLIVCSKINLFGFKLTVKNQIK